MLECRLFALNFIDIIGYLNWIFPFDLLGRKSETVKEPIGSKDELIMVGVAIPKFFILMAIINLIFSNSNTVLGYRAKVFWPIFLAFIMIEVLVVGVFLFISMKDLNYSTARIGLNFLISQPIKLGYFIWYFFIVAKLKDKHVY